jgi:uncharacterized protein YjiS (DUF1127 family)
MSLDSTHWSGTWSGRGSHLRRRESAKLVARLGRWLGELVASGRRFEQALTTGAAYRARRQALGALDDGTLRDIGISRSEIGSVVTESLGLVEPTRRQFVPTVAREAAPGADPAQSKAA